jgi:hypothetical protein
MEHIWKHRQDKIWESMERYFHNFPITHIWAHMDKCGKWWKHKQDMTILKMHSILHTDASETVIAILLLNIGSLVGDFNHLEKY